MDPSWTSRCAALRELSQYPQENEDLLPPCSAMEITRVTSIGPKKLLHCTPHICTMRHYTDSLLFPWSSPNDPLTKAELQELTQLWAHETNTTDSSKFCATARDFILGEPKIAALGLEEYMKQPCSAHTCDDAIAAIEQEFRNHGTEEDLTWYDYIKHQTTSEQPCEQGTRDQGRGHIALADFAAMDEAKIACLNLAHVLALRLYTSPAFKSLNIPLRTYKRDADGNVLRPPEMNALHKFPVTVYYIRNAISKLRAVESARGTHGQPRVMWRGNKDLNVSADFLSQGGVETAIISTSLTLATAVRYSFSLKPTIFKIITRSFMERGAFLEWLSVFPGEQECCFPPLTFFSPSGRHQKVKLPGGCILTVIEVTPRL
jgi:hypothetical protein